MKRIDEPVGGVVDDLTEAWNRQDHDAFAELFTEDADYITGSGAHWRGRAAIRRELASLAAGPSGLEEVTLSDVSVRLVRKDAAVALVRWRMARATRAGLFTLVAIETPEGWRIVLLHNTELDVAPGPGALRRRSGSAASPPSGGDARRAPARSAPPPTGEGRLRRRSRRG